MPEKTSHTWRCPLCLNEKQDDADHTAAALSCDRHAPLSGGPATPVAMEWVPPEGWVHVERIGWMPAP